MADPRICHTARHEEERAASLEITPRRSRTKRLYTGPEIIANQSTSLATPINTPSQGRKRKKTQPVSFQPPPPSPSPSSSSSSLPPVSISSESKSAPSRTAVSALRTPPSSSEKVSQSLLLGETEHRRPGDSNRSIVVISSDESDPEAHSDTETITPGAPPAQGTPTPSPDRKRRKSVRSKTVPASSEPRTARARPSIRRQAASAPTSAPAPAADHASASPPVARTSSRVEHVQEIDGAIEKQIRNPTKHAKKAKNLGYVYVALTEHDGNKIIKIGSTTQERVKDRLKAIECRCGATIRFPQLSSTSPGDTRIEFYYRQVEMLAHRELENFKYIFTCCGTGHGEYFALDENIGRMVVDRWAEFCELRPYAEDWTLKEEWKFYLDQFCKKDHGRAGKRPEQMDDHHGRSERWNIFLKSGRWDWFRHRMSLLGGCVLAQCGQLTGLFTVVLGIFWLSTWTQCFLLLVACVIYHEASTRECLDELVSLGTDIFIDCLGRLRPGEDSDKGIERNEVGQEEDGGSGDEEWEEEEEEQEKEEDEAEEDEHEENKRTK
ncbi:hypothetical protein B0T18DRAFT_408383 [Schizothecium vesticola]|uniref:Bacteriophage T5 Orf172 DNA-binding domain-containing protein n=1 Tax=Schizothecium vesticola TaxID=314040 RepID=A0AA40F2V3_9PEZI|nr:hypothetical protein B0T18DRAFT_408383 [Schizothecium vesticola]